MTRWRPEEPGSVAEEAARLAEAVEEWARTSSDGGVGAFAAMLGQGMATGAPECRLCPVCQLISTVRGVSPETVEHLLDAVAALTAAVRSAASEAGAAGRPPEERGPGVQHIDVQDG